MAEQEPDSMDSGAETDGGILSQSELDALLAAAEGEQAAAENGADSDWSEDGAQADGSVSPDSISEASVVDLPSFDMPGPSGGAAPSASSAGSMNRVRDIPLDVSVELGRTRLLIRDILELGTGSIIELDKIAGEPVDLYANGLLVARGEVIVIDDNFGVCVTEVITAAERRQIQDAEADAFAA